VKSRATRSWKRQRELTAPLPGTDDAYVDASQRPKRREGVRFGIGRFNTQAEVDYVADRVVDTVARLRELSPLYEMAKEGVDLKSVKWAAEAH